MAGAAGRRRRRGRMAAIAEVESAIERRSQSRGRKTHRRCHRVRWRQETTGRREAMTAQSGTIPRQWTRQQAAFVAVACLLAGVGGGWFLGGLRHPAPFASSASIVPSPPKAQTATPVQPDAAQLKAAADA